MAAAQTVQQQIEHCNFTTIRPRLGVATLFGYGINVRVDRGHLILEDGIGAVRREARFPRVGHGLRRLVVIGSDGSVSFAAMRWLADQNASFVMLDREGSVLVVTGPISPSDARLRRAQSPAEHSGAGVQIVRELVSKKLVGQENVAREKLRTPEVAKKIAAMRSTIQSVVKSPEFLLLESQAANAYWSAWRDLPVQYPKTDLPWVPEHWRTFGPRVSTLTRSPRLAVNPANAILNYLYAVLESETRLAITALGLDPGLGVLHVDTPSRDSFACDLMEPVRPLIDAYLFDWISRSPLRREWFYEQRDGNCRLMGPFAAMLSETARTWATAVAPHAERAARILWSTTTKRVHRRYPPTRLTQDHRRFAKGKSSPVLGDSMPKYPRTCKGCGKNVGRGNYCRSCVRLLAAENLREAAKLGRAVAHSARAQTLRAATQRRHAAAQKAWKPSDKPNWLDEKIFCEKVRPRLTVVTVATIVSTIRVSEPYATNIRGGAKFRIRDIGSHLLG
jgi:CRISPR-associated endonuclease Cas1